MDPGSAVKITAWLLDVSLKGVVLFILAGLVSLCLLPTRPAWRAAASILVVLGSAVIAALQIVTGTSPWAVDLATRLPPLAALIAAHVWLLGAVVLTAFVIRCLVRQWLIKRHAAILAIGREAAEPTFVDRQRHAALGPAMRLLRHVDLRTADVQYMPISFGVLRPTIVVPRAVTGAVSGFIMRTLLVAQFIFVLQFDALWMLCGRLVQSILFPNPCLWWAFGRFVRARELSCDQWAAYALGDPAEYAADLRLAGACRRCPAFMYVDTPLVRRTGHDLEARIARIASLGGTRPDVIGRWQLLALSVGAMLLFTLLGATRASVGGGSQSVMIGIHPGALALGAIWAVVTGLFIAVLGRRPYRPKDAPVAEHVPGAYRQTVADCVRAIEHDVQLCLDLAGRAAGPILVVSVLAVLSILYRRAGDRDPGLPIHSPDPPHRSMPQP